MPFCHAWFFRSPPTNHPSSIVEKLLFFLCPSRPQEKWRIAVAARRRRRSSTTATATDLIRLACLLARRRRPISHSSRPPPLAVGHAAAIHPDPVTFTDFPPLPPKIPFFAPFCLFVCLFFFQFLSTKPDLASKQKYWKKITGGGNMQHCTIRRAVCRMRFPKSFLHLSSLGSNGHFALRYRQCNGWMAFIWLIHSVHSTPFPLHPFYSDCHFLFHLQFNYTK